MLWASHEKEARKIHGRLAPTFQRRDKEKRIKNKGHKNLMQITSQTFIDALQCLGTIIWAFSVVAMARSPKFKIFTKEVS